MKETILILDFGGQYKELIARCVRDSKVYSIVHSGSISVDRVKEINPIGIILTGGPHSVYKESAIKFDKTILDLGIPVLGICYGMQLICHSLGGRVASADKSEYGITKAYLESSKLFDGVSLETDVLMSHTDEVKELPQGFKNFGHTKDCKNIACGNDEKKIYAVQFHPEVELSVEGSKMLDNFLFGICGAKGDYDIADYVDMQIEKVRAQVGNKRVLLGLSGGVDSSVCAALLSKAIGKQLVCIFVDHGFMRYKEGDEIEEVFSKMDLNFIRVNAQDRFLEKVKGVTDPEQKRKIIGREFAMVFEDEAKKLGNVEFLAQGTIYPDIIESGGEHNAVIKSHHNVGGLPKGLSFEAVVEPLNGLFKNEVRAVGTKLGLPDYLVNRQPFPGPGLAIRILGELTREKVEILQYADYIYRRELEQNNIKSSQYFAVLTNSKTVGVMGDSRTYEYLLCLRAVNTSDFMTCECTEIDIKFLMQVAKKIVNECKGVNRVAYDITSKPPATIEWE